MNYLVIRLADDGSASWVEVDDQGGRHSEVRHGEPGSAALEAGGRSVIVLLPSSDVLTVTTDLPLKGSRLMSALPYALEESVADDVDTLHFAPGERLEDGTLPVAVISRSRLEDWLQTLEDAGIRPERIVADYHGLASVPNTLSMLISGPDVMFNDGQGMAFNLPETKPSDVIAAAGYLDPAQESGESRGASRALLVYCDADIKDRYEMDWELLRHELDSLDINVLADGALPRLAVTVANGAGVNLLAGRYGEKTDLGALLRPWRIAAGLLIAFFAIGLAGKAVDYARLGVEEEALQAQFTQQYRDIRPNDSREIMDPIGTVNSLRRSLGSGSAAAPVFLPSLQALATALSQNESTEIEAISYRAGVIDVRLTAPDVATLDRIQQAVAASNRFTATIQSTTQSPDGLDSRIRIQEVGA